MTRRVLIAHPSPDLYGSDRQMVSAANGLSRAGWTVTVALPARGPLVGILQQYRDLNVDIAPFPVLRRAAFSPVGVLWLVVGVPVSLWRLVRVIGRVRPDVVYVNTVTIPWWVVAARLARVPVVVHVHEAEEGWPGVVRWLLTAPLLFATSVITNSAASRRVLLKSVPRLAARTSVLYNGIAGPAVAEPMRQFGGPQPARLGLVARLSPRKGVDVALEALALLRAQGRSVEMDVCGSVYPGYEWFEERLRERAAQPDLAGAVRFHGYVNPTWSLLGQSHVVLVPSRVEPFGNTAVEGMLAGRPVVASQVQGLVEIISDGRTGLLVPPDDAEALATAVGRLLDDPGLALKLAENGCGEAHQRFSLDRYHDDIDAVLAAHCTVW